MTGDQSSSESDKKLAQQLNIDFALQAAGLGIWEYNSSTRRINWDQRCRQLFGLTKDNPMSYEQAFAYIHPDDIARIDQAAQRVMNPQSDGVFDQTYRTLGIDDGKLRWVRFQGRVDFTATGEVERFAGVAQEVTQQIEAKQKQEFNDQILIDMVLNAPIGASILNAADLVIEIVNPSFIEVAGKPYEQLVGKPYWVSFAEAASHYTEPLDRVIQQGEPFYANEVELMLVRHGQPERVYVTFAYLPIKDAAGKVHKVAVWVLENTPQVLERQKIEILVRQRTKELAASNGELLIANESFTSANHALEQSNIDLIRSNQNLEQFAYIASHDLQEPLRKIQQFGDLLKSRYTNQEGEERLYLERMQMAAGRMSVLIKDLLAFSRIATSQVLKEPVSLNEVVNKTLDTLSMVIEESRAQIDVGELPVIQGDQSQLSQLFQNLLSNALKFRRTSLGKELIIPQIRVRASRLSSGMLPTAVKPTRSAKAYHLIEISDNGIGFDEKYLDRIFQVFQRLHGKNEFAGTGIGLAIVQKVVTNHGGAITAISEYNQGATFCVYLPE